MFDSVVHPSDQTGDFPHAPAGLVPMTAPAPGPASSLASAAVDRAGGRHGTRDLCGRTSRRRLEPSHNFGAWPVRAFLVPLQATFALATISCSFSSSA